MTDNEKKSSPTSSKGGKSNKDAPNLTSKVDIVLREGVMFGKSRLCGSIHIKIHESASVNLKKFLLEKGHHGQFGGQIKGFGFYELELPNIKWEFPGEGSTGGTHVYEAGELIGLGRTWRVLRRKIETTIQHVRIGSMVPDQMSQRLFDTLEQSIHLL